MVSGPVRAAELVKLNLCSNSAPFDSLVHVIWTLSPPFFCALFVSYRALLPNFRCRLVKRPCRQLSGLGFHRFLPGHSSHLVAAASVIHAPCRQILRIFQRIFQRILHAGVRRRRYYFHST